MRTKNESLKRVLYALAIAAISLPVHSQQLSLSQCLNLAHTNAPQILQAQAAEARTRAAYDEFSRQRLLQVSALGALDKSDDVSTQLPDANKAVVHVEQSVPPFSPAWMRTSQRRAELKAAGFSRLESEQDIDLLVKHLYFSILRDADALVTLDQVAGQLNRLMTSVLPKYTIGRVPPFDLVKVKTAISDLTRSRELTQAQLAGEKSQLAQLLGLGPAATFEIKPLTKMPTLPDDTALLKIADSNPTLQSQAEEIQAAEFGLRASRYARFPSLFSAFEYGYAGQTTASTTLGWDVSFGLKLNLFDWGVISSQIAQEAAAVSIARNVLAQERQDVQTAMIQARADATAHLSDERRLSELLPETHRSALAAIDRYRRGAMSILEATDAVNLWLQTLLNERSAYFSYLSDFAKLERLTGTQAAAANSYE